MWTLKKRGRVWWGSRTAEGVRERRSTRCTDERAARSIAQQWERDDANPKHHAAYTTTLGSALLRLISDRKQRGKAAGTISMYEQKIAHVARVLGADTRLADVGAVAIDHFIDTRLAEGAKRSTIGKELTAIRASLRLAIRRREFDKPLDEVMPIGWTDDYKPRKRHLSPPQLAALLNELEPEREGHVSLIAGAGLRWSESLRVLVHDINLTDGVEWTLDDDGEPIELPPGSMYVRGTKTKGSAAVIAISPLGAHLVARALDLGNDLPGDAPLFAGWDNVRRDLHAACARATVRLAEAAGVKPEQVRRNGTKRWDPARLEPHRVPAITPNDLRRTCSSWLMQSGASAFAVSKVLRHRDSRMVERVYGQMGSAHVRAQLDREVAASPMGLALSAPSTVSIACPTPVESEDGRDAGEGSTVKESQENECPGAESNRRHADFQSSSGLAPGHGITSADADAGGVGVPMVCPTIPPTFGDALDASLSLGADDESASGQSGQPRLIGGGA